MKPTHMNTNTPQADKTDTAPAPPPEMKKVTVATAREITRHFELLAASQALLTDTQSPAEFLQTLIDHGHYYDAVTFLAHAIPAREATWWACLCTREHRDNSDDAYRHAHTAAEAWVRKPTEDKRRKAEEAAEAGHYNTPASWAAAAAFWSGGSVAPAGEPAMDPPAYLYAHAVSGAIVMAAGQDMPAEADVAARYQRYLKHGINIANGGNG